MITKFQLFENKREPQIGDYVICTDKVSDDIQLQEFINNNIGVLTTIYSKKKCRISL